MRSLRLDPELDELIRRAAAREGATVSEFLRRAAADRAARTLGPTAGLDDVIGIVRSSGPSVARRTGEVFAAELTTRRRRRSQ